VRGIYAEKPFSRSLVDCDSAMSAVQAAGARLVLGTQRRYMQLYRRALEIAGDGSLGRLLEVRIEVLPESTLMWGLPHSVDLLVYFSGARGVDDVQATGAIPAGTARGLLIDCDPIVSAATIRFDNGVTGRLHAGLRFGVVLVCEYGEVQAIESEALLRRTSKAGAGPGPVRDEIVNDTMSGTVRAFVELADAVLVGAASPVSPTEVLLIQALLAGMAFSISYQGRRVRLSEVPPELSITGKLGTLFA
jgi:predicted dehydrogenase